MARILIVDDDTAQRTIMASILRSNGHEVLDASSVDSALSVAQEFSPAVIFTDLKMPGKSGLDLIKSAQKLPVIPEIVVSTAFGSIDTAVRAMQLGAYDYLTKPLERDVVILQAQRASEKFSLRVNQQEFKTELARQAQDGLIASSKAMKEIVDIAYRVAESDATILVRGETGTGKERIARLIHYASPRGKRPLQCINCAAVTDTLLESELFGYEKGAFTGANVRKIGIMEAAEGGTLFLDEVGDMAPNTQVRLLRALQEREIRRVGGTEMIKIDIRIIAATNRPLEALIKTGEFREDLYYRLNVIPIVIPPLRDRRDDILQLVQAFLGRRGKPKQISPESMTLLVNYAWPGNVRELEAVIERVAILSRGDIIMPPDLPPEIQLPSQGSSLSAKCVFPAEGIIFEEWEKCILKQALERGNNIIAEAARLTGMTYRTFQYRAEKFGLLGNSLES